MGIKRKAVFKNTKPPGGDKPCKVVTGGKMTLKLNGQTIAFAKGIIQIKSEVSSEAIKSMRVAFQRSIGSPIMVEPIEATMKLVSFDVDDLVRWSQITGTSTDEFTRWMDMRASMTAEDLEAEAFWEQASE